MTTLTRRECFDAVGLYDESLFYEDWDMWLRISRAYEFFYSTEVSAKYRLVTTSMVRSQWARLVDAMCQICVKHLKSGELEPGAREVAAAKLQAMARIAFEEKTSGHKGNLFQAMKYRPSLGILARCLLTSCGMGSEQFEQMRSVFRGKRPPAGIQSSFE